MKKLSLNKLRVELFKLHYFDSLFDLNIKGDASEVLAVILKCIHGCFIESSERLRLKVAEDEFDLHCNTDKCWIH